MNTREGIVMTMPALPAGVTRKALKAFVRAGLADAGYRGLTLARAISECSIVRVTDAETGQSKLQGFVRITPAQAGMVAIEMLQGLDLLGQPMQVMRHIHGTGFDHDGALGHRAEDEHRVELRFDLVDD